MTHQAILQQAITKAIENGWEWSELPAEDWAELSSLEKQHVATLLAKAPGAIIFNHGFAKALWGDEKIEVYGGLWTKGMPKPTTIELHQIDAYMHHLQQMVVSPDPIVYLGENI